MSSATISPPLIRGVSRGGGNGRRHSRRTSASAAAPVLELVGARPVAPLSAPARGRVRTPGRVPAVHHAPIGGTPIGDTPMRLTRRGRLTVTVTLLVLALAVLLLSVQGAAAVGVAGAPAPPTTSTISATSTTSATSATSTLTVAPGDTLWAIAERVDPHSDPRAVVERLRELNGLASAQLRAGEQLVIPTDQLPVP